MPRRAIAMNRKSPATMPAAAAAPWRRPWAAAMDTTRATLMLGRAASRSMERKKRSIE